MSELLSNPISQWVRRQWLLFTAGIASAVAMNALLLVVPALIGAVVAQLPSIDPRSWSLLLLALVGQAVFGFASTYWLGVLAARAVTDLRRSLFRRLLATTVPFHDQSFSASLLSSLTSDAQIAEQALGTLAPALVQSLPVVVAIMAVLFVQNWTLSLGLVVVVLPSVVALGLLGRSLRRTVRQGQARLAAMTVVAQESLSGIRQLKAMTQEDFALRRFGRVTADVLAVKQQRVVRQAAMEALLPLSIGVGILVVGWSLQRGRADGSVSVEQVTAFVAYFAILALNLRRLAAVYGSFEVIRGGTDRLRALQGATDDVESTDGRAVGAGPGAIRFADVSFRYPNGTVGVEGIDLRIEPGEVVALVGPNGAGKSTLLSLLLRFYPPDHGTISLDDDAATACDIRSWRRQFAVVTRDPLMFSASIAENIALGREDATDAEIEEAARTVGLHEVIARLPQGYAATIGEAGVLLSSGQRQRLALARVFLQNPRVIVLDEATTSLDAESERTFTEALHLWAGRRTILVVAHRPHPGWPINRIVRIEAGCVVGDEQVEPSVVVA